MSWPILLLSVFLLSIALLAGVLVIGAWATLDWRRRYSRRAAALPEISAGGDSSNGLGRVRVDGLDFRVRVRNLQGDGEAVVLLHGWPQTSACWQPLADALADAGFRVVAMDQRGYSPGARPRGAGNYTIDKLVGDVAAVADRLGIDRFHLVGHDWGAAVGWATVLSRPERILSWTALSIAHSFAFRDAVRNDRDQRRRSSYILLLRLPVLPELLLCWGSQYALRKIMYGLMPPQHVAEYRAMLAEPGAMTAVLNYYRAMGRGGGMSPAPEVRLPTLFIWGNRDPAAGRVAAEATRGYMRGPYRFLELDAGHWLIETRADQVIPEIVDHIREAHRGDGQHAESS